MGPTKEMRGYLGVVVIIELNDITQEFDSWYVIQAMKSIYFPQLIAWKALFHHLEGASINDYHKFWMDCIEAIESWKLHWFSYYYSITSSTQVLIQFSNGTWGRQPDLNPFAKFFQVLKKNYGRVKEIVWVGIQWELAQGICSIEMVDCSNRRDYKVTSTALLAWEPR